LRFWYDEMQRNRARLARARAAVPSQDQWRGCAFALLDPEVEEKVCARLGLRPALVSTQIVQRDSYAEYLCTLAVIASSLDSLHCRFRHWQRTEVREAQEKFKQGQKGERDAAQAQSDSIGTNLWHGPRGARAQLWV